MAVEIRAMNRCVAYRARLILRCLAVKVRCSRGPAERGSGVALQANDVQIAGLDQSGIGRTVWRMAGHATLGLDWLVLKNKRSLFVSVARVAHLISSGSRA